MKKMVYFLLFTVLINNSLRAQEASKFLQIEISNNRVLSLATHKDSNNPQGYRWGPMFIPFKWPFTQTPVIVTTAIGFKEGDKRNPYITAAVSNSPKGFFLAMTDRKGRFIDDTIPLDPPPHRIKAKHLFQGIASIIAVVPDPQKGIQGKVEARGDGDEIKFTIPFKEIPVIVVNAQSGSVPLKAVALNSSKEGFTLRITKYNGESVGKKAWIQWLAVLPGENNPFRGKSEKTHDNFNVNIFPQMITISGPVFVSNAHFENMPLLTSRIFTEYFEGNFDVAILDEKGEHPDFINRNWVETQWLGVEPFYNSKEFTKCRMEPVKYAESHKGPSSGSYQVYYDRHGVRRLKVHAIAEARGTLNDLAQSAISKVDGTFYKVIKIHGPQDNPDKKVCMGDISFDVKTVGTIDRWATISSPAGAAVGQYYAEIKTGIIADGTNWHNGILTPLWNVRSDPWRDFFGEVADILIGEAVGFGVGRVIGPASRAAVGVAINALEQFGDSIKCDTYISKKQKVTFNNIPFKVGQEYKVFLNLKAETKEVAAGIYAHGFTKVDFANHRRKNCDNGARINENKGLNLTNIKIDFRE